MRLLVFLLSVALIVTVVPVFANDTDRRDIGYGEEREESGERELGRDEERREEEMRRANGTYDEEIRERQMGSQNGSNDRFYEGENGRFHPRSDDSDEGL